MTMQQIIEEIISHPDVLDLAPGPGTGHPELSWGDHFFYLAPDGQVPTTRQPFATIVTKDYPDDAACALDGDGRWRLNIHLGRDRLNQLAPAGPDAAEFDPTEADRFLVHPVYGHLGWVAVINPGPRTLPQVREMVRAAHQDERRRLARR